MLAEKKIFTLDEINVLASRTVNYKKLRAYHAIILVKNYTGLRNLYELSRLSNVWIVPPMMTFYQKPESIDDMVTHLAAKLLLPFGVEVKEYRRWKGC